MKATSKRITENYRMILNAVSNTQEPSETIACLLQCGMVWDEIKETVAVAVFIKHWSGDARISWCNYNWSVNVLDDLHTRGVEGSDEIAEIFGNPTEFYLPTEEIHTAHLDQLASHLRIDPSFEFTDPSPEEVEEVEEAFEDYAVEECTSELQEAPSEPQEETFLGTFLKGCFTLNRLRQSLEIRKDRSAWSRGVTNYALELIDDETEDLINSLGLKPFNGCKREAVRDAILNGADSWHTFSWGGSSLIYDEDIAKRLCTPSELKKTHNGQRDPNEREQWLDTQARALFQAEQLIMRTLQENGDLTR